MTLTEFIDSNKSAVQSSANKAASPFGLYYQDTYMNLIEFKYHMMDYLKTMIEFDVIDSNGMTPTQAITIMFDGIFHKQPIMN